MTAFEKYKDYDLCYHEGANGWYSNPPVGEHYHPSLKALKAAIDKAATDERRVSKPALLMKHGWNRGKLTLEVKPVTITTLAVKKSWESEPTEVWIKDDKDRRKVQLIHVFPDTQETRDAIVAYEELDKLADEARQKAADFFKSIKRFEFPKKEPASINEDQSDL